MDHHSFAPLVPQPLPFRHPASDFSDSDFCNGSLISAFLQLSSDNFKQPLITALTAVAARCGLPISPHALALLLPC